MKWFVEERNFHGGWNPAVYYSKEPPSQQTTSGKRTFRKDPVKIVDEHIMLDFTTICAIYGQAELSLKVDHDAFDKVAAELDKIEERRLHLS